MALIENGGLNEPSIDQLSESILETGAVDQALEQAKGYISAGMENLSRMPAGPEREALVELARYVVKRSI